MSISSRFDLQLVYKPGKSHVVPDALSRAFPVVDEAEDNAERSLVSAFVCNATRLKAMEYQVPSEEETLKGIDSDSFVAEIAKSEYCGVYQVLLEKKWPNEVSQIREVTGQLKNFVVQNKILYFIDAHSSELLLFVPEKFRSLIFHERHDKLFGVHSSGAKIHNILKRQFFWQGLRNDCEKWALACPVCTFTRRPRKNTPPLLPVVAAFPFDLVCLDILKMGMTTRGNKYALVMVDHFTKYLIAIPLLDKSSESVARAIVENLILTHGSPKKLHSDKGTEFLNKIMDTLINVLKIGYSTTSGYNPRANGVVERANGSIISMLRKSCPIPQEWDERLPYCVFAYNITPHESTGESPFYSIFGRDVSFPSDLDSSLLPTKYMVDLEDYQWMIAQNIDDVTTKIRNTLERQRLKFKYYYDKNKKAIENKYHVGQRVMLYNPRLPNGNNKKLEWRFFGPFIIEKLENNNALVRPIDKPKAGLELVPIDRLSPIPKELPEISYSRKPPRERLIRATIACTKLGTFSDRPMKDVVVEEFTFDGKIFTTPPRKILRASLWDENGLGPLSVCDGTAHHMCNSIYAQDMLMDLRDCQTGQQKVKTLAQQVLIRAVGHCLRGQKLEPVVKEILKKPPDNISDFLEELKIKYNVELEIEKAVLFYESTRRFKACTVIQRSLSNSGLLPIKVCGLYPPFTSNLAVANKIVCSEEDAIGALWEYNRASKMDTQSLSSQSDPFIAYSPPGMDGPAKASKTRIVAVDDVKEALHRVRNTIFLGTPFPEIGDVKEALHRVRNTIFLGTVRVVFYFVSPEDLNNLDLHKNLVELAIELGKYSLKLYVIPPAPSKFPAYKRLILLLNTREDLGLVVRPTPNLRSFCEIGWSGENLSKEEIKEETGHWTIKGLIKARRFLVETLGLEMLQYDVNKNVENIEKGREKANQAKRKRGNESKH
uniref:RNA-directed DNA polymerase n=1 Tax=Acrobeloides nanus TaxID=290746 RepID=A0A914E400_9BILA